jgi:hypothetical protein
MKKICMVGLLLVFLAGCSGGKQKETQNSSSIQGSQSSQQKKGTEKSSTMSSETNGNSPSDNNSNSVVTDDTSETIVVDSSELDENANANAVTPVPLRGTWVGNNGEVDIEFTITETAIITNGQTYTVTGYSQSGNTYTIDWDVNSVANPGNPQPFIYTYSPDTDELSNSIIFQRK